ncbi:hypothetical protein SAMN05216198_3397 [Halopseudomonas litoralis]|uniref:DUF192 domain-containing protein n=1 Tax=Halopseudomonas litoralis TaxID=797277 RepID=A0A1H1WUK6_9GAMM|nr:DUF192 domain-containing protein [Halopseudomonas litoralis]SDT00722.1 hypothetical protein SAMN05216198_3397 [Halopseudomonas litoralis]
MDGSGAAAQYAMQPQQSQGRPCWYALTLWLLIAFPLQAHTIEATLGDRSYQLELVADPDSRRQGLMGRTELAPGTGMLFDFPEGTRPAIWMRNMQMSLDLLFVDEHARLLQIFADVPPCTASPCVIYQADQPLRFVIEVSPGTAEDLGLQPGDHLDLADHNLTPPPAY